MRNCQIEVKDKRWLVVTVDLQGEPVPSQSGRSWTIASSEGNVLLIDEDGYRKESLNISVFCKEPPPGIG